MKIKKISQILLAAFLCFMPLSAQASASDKPQIPLSVEGLYPYNEKAYSYTINKSTHEPYETVYVITREDIPCFLKFKSMLSLHGTKKTVKIIPVLAKIGFDAEKLEKNNYLLYFYIKALNKKDISFPFILTKKDNQIITHQGCPDDKDWTKYF